MRKASTSQASISSARAMRSWPLAKRGSRAHSGRPSVSQSVAHCGSVWLKMPIQPSAVSKMPVGCVAQKRFTPRRPGWRLSCTMPASISTVPKAASCRLTA